MKHFIVQNPSIEELQKISQEYAKDAFVTFFATDIEIIKEFIQQEISAKLYCIIDNKALLNEDILSTIQFLFENKIECEIKLYRYIPEINKRIFKYIPNVKVTLIISKKEAENYVSLLQELHNSGFKTISIVPDFEEDWGKSDWDALREQIKYYCDFLGQSLALGKPYVRLYDFENMCKKIMFNNLQCLTQHEPVKYNVEENCLKEDIVIAAADTKCGKCAMYDICNFVVSCKKVKLTQQNNKNMCEWNKILIHNILYFLSLFDLIEVDDEYFTEYMNFLLRG